MSQYTTISAWIYDPTKSLFGDKSGHAARYKIDCENPSGCDIFTKSNTCILTQVMSSCKFGRKTCVKGPTKRAQNFYSWMADQRKQHAEFIGKLESNRVYNRIAKINGYYYLPYSYMSKRTFGTDEPLSSPWVSEDKMTADLLDRICHAQPRAMTGGILLDYQKKEIPKFLMDLRMFYPEIFVLLSEENQKKAESASYIGRSADIVTCLPGKFIFGKTIWDWDGKKLIGKSMLFPPVKGEITITIIPERGQPVTITDNSQVGPETVFLD